MRKILMAIVTTFAFAMAGISLAAELKIAVIDVQEILQKAPQIKQINETLTKKFKPRQEKILAHQEKLKADIQKLERNNAVLSATEKTKLQAEIVAAKREFERQSQDYQQDLNTDQNQAMQQFFNQLKVVIDKVAKKEQYDIIFQKEGVPYATAKVDITKQIIEELS